MARPSRLVTLPILLASLAAPACGSGGNTAAPPPPADAGGPPPPGDAAAPPVDAASSSPLRLVVEPDQGMQPIYDFVSSAKTSIDMTMYELVDTQMVTLLSQAAKNGVAVRVILDQNLEMMSNQTAYDALGAAGVQMHWADTGYSATHQKTITVDGKTSAVMSLNLAASEYPTSRDFAVFDTDATDVAAIETTFAADFTNTNIAPPNGDDLVWSPTNATSALVGIIAGAQQTLLVENEEMGNADIVNALLAAAGRGVDVKVVMENSRTWTIEFGQLQAAGVKLAVYRHAAIYIHAKVIIADYGTSAAKVFVGSENFSVASLRYNRELGILTADTGILDGLQKTLSSDYTGGSAWTAPDAGAPPDAAPPPVDAATTDAAVSDAPDPVDAPASVDGPAD
jgi:phosphatidylserine/phosphatidylglycerophosphate/cardiolipin synthase-like enzyme